MHNCVQVRQFIGESGVSYDDKVIHIDMRSGHVGEQYKYACLEEVDAYVQTLCQDDVEIIPKGQDDFEDVLDILVNWNCIVIIGDVQDCSILEFADYDQDVFNLVYEEWCIYDLEVQVEKVGEKPDSSIWIIIYKEKCFPFWLYRLLQDSLLF